MSKPDQDMVFHRVRSMSERDSIGDNGQCSLLASTQDAVDWGGWREILVHSEGSIDMGAARTLLINHNSNQIAGGISGMKVANGVLTSDAEIDADARLQSGVSVRKAVKQKYLGGVSIGYTYDSKDTHFDEESRTLTVNKWRLLEISLTPIPADGRAQVRSLPFDEIKIEGVKPEIIATLTPAAPAASTKNERSIMTDPIKPQDNTSASGDEKIRADELKNMREQLEVSQRETKLRKAASDHNINIDGFDFAAQRNIEDGLMALMKRKADVEKTAVPASHPIQITVDAADKAREAVAGAVLHMAGYASDKETQGNPLVGRSLQKIVRRYAAMVGERAENWDNVDAAWFALGKPEMIKGRSAANVTTGSFPSFVFLNAITKAVIKGYERRAENSKYRKLLGANPVVDFKQFSVGGLSMGNLQKTVENAVFPELVKSEGVYSSTAKMWGGTMSLTLQALVSDDTGEFTRNLRMAGAIADKTQEKRTFQKLLMGTSADEGTSTWTSNTTSGTSPTWTTADTLAAARAKVNLGIVALMNKVGLDGNPLGTMPRFLIAGPTAGGYLTGLMNPSPGQTVGNAYAQDSELIVTPWLEAAALIGYSTTTFYAMGAPDDVTGLLLSEIIGMEAPQVMPYDPGATAALNWKIFKPFEVDLVYATISSTATISAAQQCTT